MQVAFDAGLAGGELGEFELPQVAALDAEHGVVDQEQRVFGYQNLLICDGSTVPANPGVNPSLTITAMTERAMAKISAKSASPQ